MRGYITSLAYFHYNTKHLISEYLRDPRRTSVLSRACCEREVCLVVAEIVYGYYSSEKQTGDTNSISNNGGIISNTVVKPSAI